MNRHLWMRWAVCLVLSLACPTWYLAAEGQLGESKMGGLKPLEPLKQKAPPPKLELPPAVKPPEQVPQYAGYLHPGILVNLRGTWEGSDHLLNLTNNIGLYVKLLKPEEENLSVTEKDLQTVAEAVFNEANIRPVTLAVAGKPPLPAFEIEVFVYPIERGYTAFIEGRLFESVVLERFKMDANMAFQAVTWEKQTLIVGPQENFGDQLKNAVKDIAEAFGSRFQAYERLKK